MHLIRTKPESNLYRFYRMQIVRGLFGDWGLVRNWGRIGSAGQSRTDWYDTEAEKTKGCLSRETGLAMVFKLAKSAERHWRRFDGANRLGQLIEDIEFRNGEPIQDAEDKAAA